MQTKPFFRAVRRRRAAGSIARRRHVGGELGAPRWRGEAREGSDTADSHMLTYCTDAWRASHSTPPK